MKQTLADVVAKFLRFFGEFGPSLLPVRRGDEKTYSYPNSQPCSKSNYIPTGAVVIEAADGVGHPSDAIRGDLVTVVREVTKIVNLVADSLSHTFSGTIGLIQDEKTGSECYLKKL